MNQSNIGKNLTERIFFSINLGFANPKDFENVWNLRVWTYGSFDEREVPRNAVVWHAKLQIITRVALKHDVSVIVGAHPRENRAIYEQILPDV